MKYVNGTQKDETETPRELRHRELARKAACEGIVLLENDGTLPLNPGKLALYGSGAVNTIKGGTGSGEVNERYSVSIAEGLKKAGFEITTQAWLDEYDRELAQKLHEHEQKCFDAVKKSGRVELLMDVTNIPFAYPVGRPIDENDVEKSETDTAVYVVARQAGESGDKKLDNGDFELFPEEIEHLRFLSGHYPKTVLVINSGSSMDLSPLDSIRISAVIFFCQQGEEGGTALGEILSGRVNPSGKLSDTWAKSYADIPFGERFSYLSGDLSKEYYHEGIYVGYRYFDTFRVEPRYHFGYGLSYTVFEITMRSLYREDLEIIAETAVKNIGGYAGKEVVQAYISCPPGKLDREEQSLAAFAKTRLLEPGEEQVLRLEFSLADHAAYDAETASRILEKGVYQLRVGNSSDRTIGVYGMKLEETVTISCLRNCCAPREQFEELHSDSSNDLRKRMRTQPIEIEDFKPWQADYSAPQPEKDPETTAVMEQLNEKEMIDLCVGAGLFGSISGKKIVTPGTVGRTTDRLYKKGLVNVNLSDGPAGIRILRRSCTKFGMVRGADYSMSFMKYLPKWVKWIIMADPKRDKLEYQFCTAFPVETSLAQTWNTELCEEIGRAISEEMETYNITYWLAPAMNIHRNPLGGRNFEYYSEDPYLTGKIAAAVVRGVQSIPGNYAVVKHFACNNQEDNRNRSNSVVSERALREIYLRGFEICIREAAPAAVMSSYNLLNGVYTPNSYDLLTDILRNEWGFDGIVMSDWSSTDDGLADNGDAIAAGNDLIMPGGKKYKKALSKALKEGRITREDLYRSASRIARQILHSAVSAKYPPESFS